MTDSDLQYLIRMAREGLADSKLCREAKVAPEHEAYYRAAYLEGRMDALIRGLERLAQEESPPPE